MLPKSFTLSFVFAISLGLVLIVADLAHHGSVPTVHAIPIAIPERPLVKTRAIPTTVSANQRLAPAVQTNSIVLAAAADTYVDQSRPTSNFGGDTSMVVRQLSGGTDLAALLVKFDLAEVPADALVVSATLSLYTPRVVAGPAVPAAPAFTMTPYHLSSWVEFGRGSATWNTKPTFTAIGDPSTVYGSNRTDFDVTQLVSGWVNGTLANNGMGIAPDLGVVGEVTFGTRESSYVPQLAIYYTLRTTLDATQDTFIDEVAPSSNFDGLGYLTVWYNSSPYRHTQTLLDFDWSVLPPYIQVSRATLEMYTELNLAALAPAASAAGELPADAILNAWDETTVTWNTRPGRSWRGDPAANLAYNGWTSWDVTQIVQGWASGTLQPHGILVRMSTSSSGRVDYFDRSRTNAPRLIVEYITVPPPCQALTSASISGPTVGQTGVSYDFNSTVTPLTADPPFAYTWTATEQSGSQNTADVAFTWDTPGTKQINLSVQNCGGTVNASFQTEIQEPPPSCSLGLSGLDLSAPLTVRLDSNVLMQASVRPPTATVPFTYTWQADDQTDASQTTNSATAYQTYRWSITGTKLITVSASNCGGTIVRSHQVDVLPDDQLPDLFVSGSWFDPGRNGFYALLRNQGAALAPAGHTTMMEVDTVPVYSQPFTETLAPDSIRALFMDYPWSCAGTYGRLVVTTDSQNVLAEQNESNNDIDSWEKCDQQPPVFLSGPTVVTTTEQTAVLAWQTDEPTRYKVSYSRFAYMSPLTVQDINYNASSQVTLTGLEPAHTYYFQVEVRDQAGHRANSRQMTFQTQPPGTDPPDITNLDYHPWNSAYYEFYRVYADVADAQYVDRVEFYLDGHHLGTDYTPASATSLNVPRYDAYLSPYALGYTRNSFFSDLTLEARAFALNGKSSVISRIITPVDPGLPFKLQILQPRDDQTVYLEGARGTLRDSFRVYFDAARVGWGCTWSGISEGSLVPPGQSAVNCQDVASRFSKVRLLLDDREIGQDSVMPITQFTGLDLLAKPINVYPGTYDMVLEGYSGDTLVAAVTQTVHFQQGTPNVVVTRTVRRIDNTLEIQLTLKNEGTLPSRVDKLEDNIKSFQQINTNGTPYDVKTGQASFEGSEMVRRNYVIIDLHESGKNYVELDPGEFIDLYYIVVPVMYDTATYEAASIGDLPLKVYVNELGVDQVQRHSLPAVKAYEPTWGADMSLQVAIQGATHSADYIIVTSPQRLYSNYVDQTDANARNEVERLFSRMAELAALKQGILGYIHSNSKNVLDDLIEPGGWWARQMNPVFKQRNGGFVLLVGETEIIPSFYVGTDHFITGPNIPDLCRDCDLPYANTQGQTARPELIVGRLVGDSLGALHAQFDVTLGVANGLPNYGNDRSHGVLVSGRGEHANKFRDAINLTEYHLFPEFSLTKMHWSHMANQAERTEALTTTMPGTDVLIFDGHGNLNIWGDGLTSKLVHDGQLPLGGTNPMAVAVACSAGNYEKDDDYNLPDVLMTRGFGNYFASTGISEIWTNGRALVKFAYEWDPGEAIGKALNDAKHYIWGYETVFTHGELWAYQYNLYGDPKFAYDGLLAPLRSSLAPIQDTYDIHLPDLTHHQVEGYDEFEIPGQPVLLDLGYYPTPFWTLELEYPAGTRLQSVSLINQGAPEPMTGITMTLNQAAVACATCENVRLAAVQPAAPVITSWTPSLDQPVTWRLEDNADGSSTVEVSVYPFHFNPTTGDALYFRDFTLEMHTITTGVKLDEVSVLPGTLNAGDVLTADLRLSNSGASQDVVIQASVRLRGSSKLVTGLPLETIHQLSGNASVQLTWDSDGLAQGDYQLLVELLDSQGNLLAAQVDEFDIGIVAGQVTSLSASVDTIKPGEPISLTLTFVNTGTVPYSGTATIQLQPVGNITDSVTFHVEMPLLAAAQTWTTTVAWDTSGATADQYRVIGLVRYQSQATDPVELRLGNGFKLFLPLAMHL